MVIKYIDPNKGNNQGLVNHYKIRLRRLSSVVHFIAKNHIKRSRYNSLYPRKDIFEYIPEFNGHRIVCGLIFLKLMMTVMNPQCVVDHCSKEKELKEMTLANYGHDVSQLLTSIQEKKN